MSHYILELALWLLGAYFIGCFLGAFARSLSPATVVSQPLVAAAPVVAPVAEVPAAPAKSVRPTGIQGPREERRTTSSGSPASARRSSAPCTGSASTTSTRSPTGAPRKSHR